MLSGGRFFVHNFLRIAHDGMLNPMISLFRALRHFFFSAAAFALPFVALAHEVYVLDPATVSLDVGNPSPNPFLMAIENFPQFFLWTIVAIVVISAIFLISISRKVEKFFYPFLLAIKSYASTIARITLGLSLIFSAYNGALFGPELPLSNFSSHQALFLQSALFATGFLILIGFFTRASAAVALALYAWLVSVFGAYMFTYFTYFGEILIVFILGSGTWSLDSYRGATAFKRTPFRRFLDKLEPYSFAILRVCLGTAILYASWYAKFIHSSLAFDTVIRYHLTDYFPFPVLFVVLGALLIETLIGIFFIVGFEIRFASLFFIFFLGLSLLYFGEAVWPHLILLGINLALFAHGYDRYSLEGKFFKGKGREPVF